MTARKDTSVAVSKEDYEFLVAMAAAENLSVKAYLAEILRHRREG